MRKREQDIVGFIFYPFFTGTRGPMWVRVNKHTTDNQCATNSHSHHHHSLITIFFCFAFILFSTFLTHLYHILWLKPKRLREKPSFLYGNLMDITSIQNSTAVKLKGQDGVHLLDNYFPVFYPYLEQWRRLYGNIFMYSMGPRVHLCVTRPDLVKDISQQKYMGLGKPSYLTNELGPILGNGIIRSNGHWWAQQKKIMAPEFFMDKVKGMVGLMVESTITLLKSWENRIASEGGIADIKIGDDLRDLSADVISRACFGSSYGKGKEIFITLEALKQVMSKKNILFGIPSFSYLPTKNNMKTWKLEIKAESLILNSVKQRRQESTSSKDLLMIILENANSGLLTPGAAKRFIVDNCKSFYFAGYDTSAIAAQWYLMLLASHPEWQIRAHAEVEEVCSGHLPNADSLVKMKLMTMVIQESLRLYPPTMFVAREVIEEVKLGDLRIPKGINIWIPISTMHRDPAIWGEDANEFKRDRFANGISSACNLPNAYIPFGMGSRTRLGQNLAMVELKIILSLLLSKFSLSLSPKYQHFPVNKMFVQPGYGVDLLIKRI